jgi:hypothetical protein
LIVQRFMNALKAQAGALDLQRGQPRLALVTSVDPSSSTARVSLQPEGVLTGWLPIATAWSGAGWGLICPPTPGDQVLVIPQEGDAEHGILVARLYSATQPPPAAPSGELWLVHQSGSSLKLTSDGTIRVQGDLHVAGDVYDAHGPMSGLRAHYDEHVHPSAGSRPSPQD